MQLSEHFTLEELTKSDTAQRLSIDNSAPPDIVEKLKKVCEHILEPVRAHFGKPVKVNSGYRCPALNKATGGAKDSQHMTGQAADLEIEGVPNRTVAEWIRDNCNFDQVILEFYNPKEGANSGWVHASFAEGACRKKTLTALKNGKKTVYINGFIVS